jgi:hypothetical protein
MKISTGVSKGRAKMRHHKILALNTASTVSNMSGCRAILIRNHVTGKFQLRVVSVNEGMPQQVGDC